MFIEKFKVTELIKKLKKKNKVKIEKVKKKNKIKIKKEKKELVINLENYYARE